MMDENTISFCEKCNKTVCNCEPAQSDNPINEGVIEELFSMVRSECDQLFKENLRLRTALTRIYNAAQNAHESANSHAALSEILKESKEAL